MRLELIIKVLIMKFLYFLAEIWGFLRRRRFPKSPKKIVILFLRNLGIGDLVMLSPAIQKMSDIFPNSEIYLATFVEEIFNFKGIKFISPKEFKKRKKEFDMMISPTMCLKHWKYIFSFKYWFGYFSYSKIQSNFKVSKYKYDIKKGRYLLRGIYLIKALNKEIGDKMELLAKEKNIVYPSFILKEPEYFQKELSGKRYLALSPVSKFKDRQWPLKNFAETIRYLFQNNKIEKVAFLGDSSDWDKDFINSLISELNDLPRNIFLNVAGKNTLTQTIFLIKNSEIFIGLDSCPAHFAYLSAKRTLAIFINVNPDWRTPLCEYAGKVVCLHPDSPDYACYTGLGPAHKKKCQELAESISVEKAIKAINKMF